MSCGETHPRCAESVGWRTGPVPAVLSVPVRAAARQACRLCLALAASILIQRETGAADALLVVKSDPTGASVLLDDEAAPRGNTPCAILVAPGRHVVRAVLAQAGGEAKGSAEVVTGGAPVTVEIKLTKPREGSEAPARAAVGLQEFDSLVDRGDYAAARGLMERARGGDEAVVRAALGLADALAARRKAVHAAARALSGKVAELRTTRGKLSGEVADVTDEGVVLVVKKKLRGMGTVETRIKVKWPDLAPEEEDALARTGGWRSEGTDTAIVRAYLALARKDVRAAERALLQAGGAARDHPLAAHVRRRIEAPRREAAERAARTAWEEIGKAARAAGASPGEVRGLVAKIEAFEKGHRGADFAASVKDKAAAMKRRAMRSLLPTRGLVAYWPLDESEGTTARDVSGNGHHGTLHGGALWQPDGGRVDGALRFGGGNQYVDCGTVPGSAAALTLAFWMKADSVTDQIPVDKHPADKTGVGWTIKLKWGDQLRFRIGSTGKYSDLKIGSAYAAGAWVHVACTFRTGEARVYCDGMAKGSQTGIRRTVGNTTTSLHMGRPSVAYQRERFRGLLDDVRIYDRALTATEIRALAAPD